MFCPKCKSDSMKKATPKNTDVSVDYCTTCKGIWFGKDELEKVGKYSIKDLSIPKAAAPTTSLCPNCVEPLYKFNYPQTLVKIDMCKKCKGLWLDKSEYKEIQHIRKKLSESGQANEYAEVTGIKGKLLKLIESGFGSMTAPLD